MKIAIKRVYEPAAAADGARILVDRLWPRGLSKAEARIDAWLKDIAPSNELREWFNHDPAKWAEFQRRYHAELDKNKTAVEALTQHMGKDIVTLLYGAKDEAHNNAVALREYLQKQKS